MPLKYQTPTPFPTTKNKNKINTHNLVRIKGFYKSINYIEDLYPSLL